jgi:putative addiction module component (TIGR02574 family)
MSHSLSPQEVEQLSVPQRLELIGVLWDSIPGSDDAFTLPEWHRDEIERRLTAAEASPEAAIPWEEVKARLRREP